MTSEGWIFAGNSDRVTWQPGPGDNEWTLTTAGKPKVSKASVDYRRSYWPWRRCGGCLMFRAPGSCTLVAGRIKPGDVCDEWEPK